MYYYNKFGHCTVA